MKTVEELEAEVRKLEEWIHVALDDRDYYQDEAKKAAAKERAAIVAHLRRDYLMRDTATAGMFADAIEQQHDRWGQR